MNCSLADGGRDAQRYETAKSAVINFFEARKNANKNLRSYYTNKYLDDRKVANDQDFYYNVLQEENIIRYEIKSVDVAHDDSITAIVNLVIDGPGYKVDVLEKYVFLCQDNSCKADSRTVLQSRELPLK